MLGIVLLWVVFTCMHHDYIESLDPHAIIIIRTKYTQITHNQTIKHCPKTHKLTLFLHHSCTRMRIKDWSEPTHNTLWYHSHIYSLYIKRCRITIALCKINRFVYFSHIDSCRTSCKGSDKTSQLAENTSPRVLHNYMT